MSAIIIERYDVLKETGPSDDKARCGPVRGPPNTSRFSKTEADPLVRKRAVGFILAGVASPVVKTFVA